MKAKYFTEISVARLRSEAEKRLDLYYSSEDLANLASMDAVRDSRVDMLSFADRLSYAEPVSGTDVDNALCVFDALKSLKPKQAADERLWVYLCHNECADYVRRRWLGERPVSDDVARSRVLNHFFARDNRALIRDNGISRLWWLGHIAHRIDSENPRQFLEIVLHRQDVRSALLERPSVAMNERVLRSIYEVMLEHWQSDRELFQRETFRRWMVGLNRRGGVILLDALDSSQLDELVRGEARIALES